MADPFYGEIRPFAFTFAPYNWAFCLGQSANIQQYNALYAVIGTQFGGDGVTTFKLPDLQGRTPIHRDNVTYAVGQANGTGTVTLTPSQCVAHTHALQAANVYATQMLPGGGATPPTASLLAQAFGGATGTPAIKLKPMYADPTAVTPMSPNAVSAYGSEAILPHDNNQPSLVLNFCIALYGEWPQRP